MRIENAGIHRRERVHVRVAHRKYHTGHSALVESEDTETVRAHEGKLPSACNDEFEIANLSLEILGVGSRERGVRADQRSRRDHETAAGKISASAANVIGDS